MATIHKLTKDGATIFPATITDAVVHPQTGKTLTSMIKDYNVSELFPTEGIDGGNKYNLALAIQVLGIHLSDAQKTGGIKLTFISSVSNCEEEYYLGKSSWSATSSDWDQRFEVGDVIADPSGSWEPSTAEAYIDQKVGEINVEVASEIIARQTVDSNLQTQINTEVSTRSTNDTQQNNRLDVLEEAYRSLTESDVIVGPRPSTGQQANVIYREPDQGHTPPQFYCDYMWYDNDWVLMAQYDNGIDNNPLPNSNNLVKSSGVFNSMGAYDISANNSGHIYQNLTEALNAVPSAMRVGGVSVKFIQEITPAKYNLVKTEGLTTEPTGTELSSDPNLVSGTYTAAQLNNLGTVSALPTTLNSSKTYYLEVAGDSTTYTTWVVTYVSTSDNKYIQARCMSQNFTTDVTQWQGVDTIPTPGSTNLVESGGAFGTINEQIKNYSIDASACVLARELDGYRIGETSTWEASSDSKLLIFEVGANKRFKVIGTSNTSNRLLVQLMASYNAGALREIVYVGNGNYVYYGETTNELTYVGITVDVNSTNFGCILVDGVNRIPIIEQNIEEIDEEIKISNETLSVFDPVIVLSKTSIDQARTPLTDYVINTDATGSAIISKSGYSVIIYEVGPNTPFEVRGKANGNDATLCAVFSGASAGHFGPWSPLLTERNEEEFIYKGVTDSRSFVAITVEDGYTNYYCKSLYTINKEVEKNTDNIDVLKNSAYIFSDNLSSVRVINDTALGNSESGNLLATANGYDVIMFDVGENTNFRVKGNLDIQYTRCAILSGTSAGHFGPWNILLPKGDSGDYVFDSITDTRRYIAISVKHDTQYFCKRKFSVSAVVEDLNSLVRKQVKVNATDTQVEILQKMILAYTEGNYDVYFEKSTYVFDDVYLYMRDTLGWSWTMELPIGNNCKYFFNGSTIISNAPTETYNDSRNVLGCKAGASNKNSYELYDGILINNGGTYCVHDECARGNDSYEHKYHNMRMYYNYIEGVSSNIGKCIGGGAGVSGVIIINDCIFLNNMNTAEDCVSWHGLDGQNNADMSFFVNNNYFNKRFRVSQFFKNGDKLFVQYSNNANGSMPAIDSSISGVETYVYNNELITT